MRTNVTMISAAAALLLTAGALFGQTSDNVVVSAPPGLGPVIADFGPIRAQTFAFVAGELSGKTVKGAPYSALATTQTTQTLADGNQIVRTSNASVYRDAEGRERREQAVPNTVNSAGEDTPAQMVLISDPVAGANYALNTAERTAMKTPLTTRFFFSNAGQAGVTTSPKTFAMQKVAAEAAAQKTDAVAVPDGPIVSDGSGPRALFSSATAAVTQDSNIEEKLGTQSIAGVPAEGTRHTLTIPAGQMGNTLPIQIVDEVWRSPDLHVIVQSTHSDPRIGTTIYTLTNISRTEPSASLFQVPSDYTVQEASAMKLALDKEQAEALQKSSSQPAPK